MLPNRPFYSEKQRFRHWWLWALILPGPGFLIWAIFRQIFLSNPVGNNPINDIILIVLGLIFGVGFPLFIFTMGLDTEVRKCGVFIRFRPFHQKWVLFDFDSIQKIEAITYSPLKDYGGWGMRYGRRGKAYNVSGNKGVLLTLENDKTVLIGSKNHEMLWSAITARIQYS